MSRRLWRRIPNQGLLVPAQPARNPQDLTRAAFGGLAPSLPIGFTEVTASGTNSTTGQQTLIHDTVVKDNYSAYNNATGEWTAPADGVIVVMGTLGVEDQENSPTSRQMDLEHRINGTARSRVQIPIRRAWFIDPTTIHRGVNLAFMTEVTKDDVYTTDFDYSAATMQSKRVGWKQILFFPFKGAFDVGFGRGHTVNDPGDSAGGIGFPIEQVLYETAPGFIDTGTGFLAPADEDRLVISWGTVATVPTSFNIQVGAFYRQGGSTWHGTRHDALTPGTAEISSMPFLMIDTLKPEEYTGAGAGESTTYSFFGFAENQPGWTFNDATLQQLAYLTVPRSLFQLMNVNLGTTLSVDVDNPFPYDTEEIDPDNLWTNPDFTAPLNGYVLFNAGADCDNTQDAQNQIGLNLAGSNLLYPTIGIPGGNNQYIRGNGLVEMAANDVLRVGHYGLPGRANAQMNIGGEGSRNANSFSSLYIPKSLVDFDDPVTVE